jgi:hypothetical protein
MLVTFYMYAQIGYNNIVLNPYLFTIHNNFSLYLALQLLQLKNVIKYSMKHHFNQRLHKITNRVSLTQYKTDNATNFLMVPYLNAYWLVCKYINYGTVVTSCLQNSSFTFIYIFQRKHTQRSEWPQEPHSLRVPTRSNKTSTSVFRWWGKQCPFGRKVRCG